MIVILLIKKNTTSKSTDIYEQMTDMIIGVLKYWNKKEGLSKRDRHIREGMLIVQHNATLNVQDPAATVNGTSISQKNANRKYYYANKEKRAEYRKCYQDTVNTCVKCGRTYRGNNKRQHQSSQRCQRIAQQRIQPVIHVNGDNNTVTVNIVTI